MKKDLLRISIITVINNGVPFLEKYFDSIAKTGFSGLEVILVDSDLLSDTKSKIEEFKKKYKNSFEITLIQSKKRIGFSIGNNMGVDRAKGRFVFLLNPDTKIDKNCLKYLYEKARSCKEKDFMIIARQKNYITEKFLIDGVCVDIFGFPYKIYNAYHPEETKPPFYCDGAAMFMPKATFYNLGCFDSEMFVFAEDIDLSWKAHLMNIPLYNEPRAIVYHYGGGTIKGGPRHKKVYVTSYFRRYLGERNAQRNILKNYKLINLIWVVPLYFSINIGEIFVFILTGKYRVAFQYIKAWWWNITNFKSLLRRRKWIQQRRKVGDIAMFKKLYFGSGKFNAFIQIRTPRFE